MKRNPFHLVLFVAILILSLAACNPVIAKPTPSPTPGAATATATLQAFPPTWTMTAAPVKPTITLTPPAVMASATHPPFTATPSTATPQGTAQFSTSGDAATFVTDVTIPDGSNFNPGDTFTKTWRLSNSGSTTWTTDYTIVYIQGNLKGSVQAVSLPMDVPSGATIDISVRFTAPTTGGKYTSLWMLKNSSGQFFGVGPNANEPFYVLINVAPAITGTVMLTPPSPGTLTATDATLSVDQPSYTGACPVTMNLTGTITTSGTGILTYQLEAGSSTSGFTFDLPGALTQMYSLDGSRTLPVTYSLNISSSVTGWVDLYISAPNTLRSALVDFTITCQ